MTRIKRVGILTGGGDAPGLNSVIEGFVSRATKEYRWTVFGIEDGFEGLIQPPSRKKVRILKPEDVKGIASLGGSILGCSNISNPWAYPITKKGKVIYSNRISSVLQNIKYYNFDALVLVGGDGTMTQAKKLMDLGVKIVGVPKTIDNDLAATDYTFGFDSAVATATWAIDKLHSTAHAHDRVILCEVMGRYAGWIALHAGIAGNAHCILIPEIPYEVERIIKKIKSLGGRFSSYAIIVVSEGARQAGSQYSTQGEPVKTKNGEVVHLPRLKGAAENLAKLLEGKIPHDIRITVLGHIQRGGSPSPFDRILGLRFGVAAADLLVRGGFGRMVALKTPNIVDVPINEVIGKPKLVDPNGELVKTARAIGIELGG